MPYFSRLQYLTTTATQFSENKGVGGSEAAFKSIKCIIEILHEGGGGSLGTKDLY